MDARVQPLLYASIRREVLQHSVGCDKRSAGTPMVRTIGVPALRLSHPTNLRSRPSSLHPRTYSYSEIPRFQGIKSS